MKTIPGVVPPKKPGPRAKKSRRADHAASLRDDAALEKDGLPGPQRVCLHDVVNQLTIMSLACFELRDPECEMWTESQRKAIDAIEISIGNTAELIQQLSKMLRDEAAKKNCETFQRSPARKFPLNNVYPISPYLKRR